MAIGADQEWYEKSCPLKVYEKLPNEEKKKYAEALAQFAEEKLSSQSAGTEDSVDSSPSADSVPVELDFDSDKWQRLDDDDLGEGQ